MSQSGADQRYRPARAGARDRQVDQSNLLVWVAVALMATAVAGYLVILIVRGDNSYWTWLDGWVICGIELLASVLCLIRALVRRPGRLAALFFGLSLLGWTLGDMVVTIQSIGGATPPSASIADLFYLAFYPLAYVAVALFMRGQGRRLTVPNLLDGAIAGFGAAATASAFVFHAALQSTGGNGVATAVNLALPVGDILLLALVVAGLTVLPGRRKAPWVLLAVSAGLIAAGDTSNLFQNSLGATQVGSIVNAMAWPCAAIVMSIAVWLHVQPTNSLVPQRPAGFVLPNLAAIAALIILFVGTLHPVGRAAVVLATGTMVLVASRLFLSVRGMERLSQERHRQAVTDELTGLWNRRYLFRVLDTFFDERAGSTAGRSMAFLFLDLDRFKEVNDTFGHPAGDQLLRKLGDRLKDSLRDTDLLVRLGGDEFAVVLIDGDTTYATQVAQRLTASLQEPFVLDVVSASIGASIGIAVAPDDASDSARLVWCADVAMYRAKLGGTPFAFYQPDLDDEGDHVRLADELSRAIGAGQLVLHYQPQLDLRSGEILAVEALIRWSHPRLGLLLPDEFLPLAEEAGLMWRITAWVFEEAAKQCAAWRASGRPISVAVNVTPSDLIEAGFVETVKEGIERYGLDPVSMVLEITEVSVITEFEGSRQVIEELRDFGVTVSIDDFGAGVTSLAYLSNLAVRELKLDRTFIMGLAGGDHHRDLDLVRSTIELGHAMGLRIVAEGIEDTATLELLSELGCDVAQGYCISRPKPADELAFRPRAEDDEAAGVR